MNLMIHPNDRAYAMERDKVLEDLREILAEARKDARG